MPTSLRYTAARLAPVGILTIAAVMSGMFPFAERHVVNILTVLRGGGIPLGSGPSFVIPVINHADATVSQNLSDRPCQPDLSRVIIQV